MHKLDRTPVGEPECLSRYSCHTHTWNDVVSADKQQIRTSLDQMQGTRCAYCEGQVYDDGHVEHFRRKNPNHFPQLTFDWANLFLSCGAQDHCGHYKDRPGADPYNPDDIIKPDADDPDTYLYFHSSGEVRPRSGDDAPDPHRALETIRVFHLDHRPLVAERRRALRLYRGSQPGVLEFLMELDDADREQFIEEEIEATKSHAHWTVIRHYFQKAH
jgi:uncharacterized protein (TIGR02646 family)